MRKIFKNIFIMLFVCFTSLGFAHSYSFTSELSNDEVIYKSAETRINTIDPTIQNAQGSAYPGYRGANQLVIYTPEYGKRTGTNEFGTEAIVINGYVVSLSGADSLIPPNGFVISGHGTAKKWINENIELGSKIFINPQKMTIISAITPESFLFAAREKIKETYDLMRYYSYQNIMYDYTQSLDYLEKAKKDLINATKRKNNIQKYSSSAIQNADKALDDREVKGVWIRPVEKNQAEIIATLDRLKNAGINNIFLETYYHAETIYPSEVLTKYNITNQNQAFVGFDPLRIWINEAHKRNIRVHAWFECFYVGNDNPRINPMHILNVYPQWANTTKLNYDSKYPTPSPIEHNGYFLDPANPAVQIYLLEVLDEILTKYQPDGINLDYIRYPQTIDKAALGYENANWGYTQFAREEFKTLYEVDPIEISKGTPEWNLWAKYRQDKISEFVKKAGEHTRGKAKITAVVFPDRIKSLETKMQDWKTWSHNNYIDGFTPLLLSCDYDTATILLQDIKKNSSKFTDIYAGLFVSFMNGTSQDLLRQVHMSRKMNTKGVKHEIFKQSINARTNTHKEILSLCREGKRTGEESLRT